MATMRASRAVVSAALGRAVDYLCRSQLPHGEFRTWTSADRALARDCRLEPSCFVTSVVLHALSFVDGTRHAHAAGRAIDFLAAEEEHGVWRYFASGSANACWTPPDLDDTACVAWALGRHGRPVTLDVERMLRQRRADGLFITYMRPTGVRDALRELRVQGRRLLSRAWWIHRWEFLREADLVVTANVVLALGENEQTLPACRRLVAAVEAGEEDTSKYYLSPYALHHAVSRALFHGAGSLAPTARRVPGRIAERQAADGSLGSPLATAMAACALLNYGLGDSETLARAVSSLLATQQRDGAWAREALFSGIRRVQWWGSEESTTAFCVEALARFLPHAA